MAEIDELEKFVMAGLKELVKDVIEGNDRSAVIVAASFIQDELSLCLEEFFVDNAEISERFLDPSKGLIQGFAPMADLAYLLGILADSVRRWIKLIAHIRNMFAHSWAISTFEAFDQFSDKDTKKTLSQLREFVIPHPFSPTGNKKSDLRLAYETLFWCVTEAMDQAMALATEHQRIASKLKLDVPDGMVD